MLEKHTTLPNAAKAAELGIDVARLKVRVHNYGDNLVKSNEALNKLIDEYGGAVPKSAVAEFRGFSDKAIIKGAKR